MDYAAALNEEIKDLFAHGADIVQVDEPYMQARLEKARQYGIRALNRALEGVTGTTAVHICFGYAAIIHARPAGYDFLPEFAGCNCKQASIETAQSNLDCAILTTLGDKEVMFGRINLADMAVESPVLVASRIKRAPAVHQAGAGRTGARLWHEVPATRGGQRQAARDGGGCKNPARRIRLSAAARRYGRCA